MRRYSRVPFVVVLLSGCPYDPESPNFESITDTDDASSSGNTLGTTVSASDPEPTATTTAATDPDSSDGDPGAVCGDGEVNGDEVCDDGTNDGSYGGCIPGCGAEGPSCGDGEVNGTETCDDGTNDGGYGGCAADCAALGPYCGDGAQQKPELCDNGAANANGSGCNVDCVTSGTVVGTFLAEGLSFCDGSFTTEPVFRDNGNVLVSASGYCDDDSVLLGEFDNDVEPVQQFDDLLLPVTPLRSATLAGDLWVLGASYDCTYALSPEGDLTEACDPGRVAGSAGLAARDDGSYIALDYDRLGSYPTGSPMAGDAPLWEVLPPPDGFYTYDFVDAALGSSGATIIVGDRRAPPTGDAAGYLARYTAAGNSAGDSTYPSVERLTRVAAGPDGSLAVASGYPDYVLLHLDDSFNEDWSQALPTESDVEIAIDSTGAVVVAYRELTTGNGVMRKWTADGATELWNIEAPMIGYGTRMAIGPDDSIWIATATFGTFGLSKISP